MRDFDIICIGEPLIEFNQINGTEWHQGFGGDVSNVAITAARLGARSAIFFLGGYAGGTWGCTTKTI